MKEDDLVVLDRNCHKSIEQGLMLTGARPVYMVPRGTAMAYRSDPALRNGP